MRRFQLFFCSTYVAGVCSWICSNLEQLQLARNAYTSATSTPLPIAMRIEGVSGCHDDDKLPRVRALFVGSCECVPARGC